MAYCQSLRTELGELEVFREQARHRSGSQKLRQMSWRAQFLCQACLLQPCLFSFTVSKALPLVSYLRFCLGFWLHLTSLLPPGSSGPHACPSPPLPHFSRFGSVSLSLSLNLSQKYFMCKWRVGGQGALWSDMTIPASSREYFIAQFPLTASANDRAVGAKMQDLPTNSATAQWQQLQPCDPWYHMVPASQLAQPSHHHWAGREG